MEHLQELLVFLTAALMVVPLAKKLGLGSVLGYLAAGLIIGPMSLGLITNVESILHFSEFGVVLLLFIIGLELEPRRLWLMRKLVFYVGGFQVILTTLTFAVIALFFGLSTTASLIVGLGMALSSTAFVMSTLAEKKQLTTVHGNTTFGVLLFQDLAVIPTLALIPLLTVDGLDFSQITFAKSSAKVLAALIFLIIAGQFLIRPVFKMIAKSKNHELFTAASLFVVIGTAMLIESVGLSMSLGAFLAGVLLANSEYRHEIEANIEPFRGLLMGLFFMAVGMSTQVGLLGEQPFLILGLLLGFITLKVLLMYLTAKFSSFNNKNALCVAINLAVGGEFAFVLFGLAGQNKILSNKAAELLILVVTLSMIIAPILLQLKDRILKNRKTETDARAFDQINESAHQVIIAGFGRFGQIVGRMLRTQKIGYIALESSAEQVDFVRKFGNTLYYGDASHVELLRAAKADRAKIIVIAIDDPKASIRTVQTVKKHFPNLSIYARARNRQHVFELLDQGVTNIYRETFLSSLEVGEHVLVDMGIAAEQVQAISEKFRRYDESTILRQHAAQIHQDQKEMVRDSKQSAAMLENLMELDETVMPSAIPTRLVTE